MTSPMTPEEARDDLEHLDDFEVGDVYETCRHSLRTIANLRAEHDHGVVDWETVDGRYEVYHRVRLVTEWRDQ